MKKGKINVQKSNPIILFFNRSIKTTNQTYTKETKILLELPI